MLSLPEILRLLHKHYGGIDKFDDLEIMNDCILHAIKKESEIPKLVSEIIQKINCYINGETQENRKLRSAEEIMKDYGLR